METLVIPKSVVRYFVLFVLAALAAGYLHGIYTPSFVNPAAIVLTQKQADLVNQAISLVREDVSQGKLTTSELIINALYGELPEDVRKYILEEFGTPKMEEMLESFERLTKRIVVK